MKSVTEIRKDIEEKSKHQYSQRVPSELMSDKDLLQVRDIFLNQIEKEIEKAIANDPYKTQTYCTLRANNIIFDKKLLEKFRQRYLLVFAVILDELNAAGYIVDGESSEITWDAGTDNYVIRIKMELYRFTEEQNNKLGNLDLADYCISVFGCISVLFFVISLLINFICSFNNVYHLFQPTSEFLLVMKITIYATPISLILIFLSFFVKVGIEKIHKHLQKKYIKNYAKE